MSAKPHDERSHLPYSRVAGLLYVGIIAIGVVKGFLIDSRILVPKDAAATAANLMANEMLFRIGTASVLVLYMCVAALAWALYVLLRTVDRNLALLALLFRSAEAVLGAATLLIDFTLLALLKNGAVPHVLGTDQPLALAASLLEVRTASLDVVLAFVGAGGTLFCYLFLTSRSVPRMLAGWGIFTYLSMLFLGLLSILIPAHPASIETTLYTAGALFEFVFGFWLLFKGAKLPARTLTDERG